MTYYIGIDNGLKGGVVMLDQHGEVCLSTVVPVVSNGKSNLLDAKGFLDLLSEIFKYGAKKEPRTVVYEKPAGSKSVRAAVSMQDSFAKIDTVLMFLQCKRIPITATAWQKTFWRKPKMAKGQKFDTKAAALKAAREIWPSEDWLATPKSRKPHDGMIDAALIAEHARRAGL